MKIPELVTCLQFDPPTRRWLGDIFASVWSDISGRYVEEDEITLPGAGWLTALLKSRRHRSIFPSFDRTPAALIVGHDAEI